MDQSREALLNNNPIDRSMSEAEFKGYFQYLRQRAWRASLYRRYFLYPRLSRFLSGRVVDVGCGIGDFLSYRENSTGVDVNPNNVAYCLRKGADAHLIDGTGRYPFSDGEFDGAMLDNVLEHLTDPGHMLAEIHRIVRSGGIFIVGVPGRKGYASAPDHERFYDEDDLVGRLGEAGFRASRILHMPLRFPGLGRVMRQYCVYGVFERVDASENRGS